MTIRPVHSGFSLVWLQMNLAERDKKRHNLTLHELEKLPEGTPTYDSCGKMFILVIKQHPFFAIIYLYIHCRLTRFYCVFSFLFFSLSPLLFSASICAIIQSTHMHACIFVECMMMSLYV